MQLSSLQNRAIRVLHCVNDHRLLSLSERAVWYAGADSCVLAKMT